LGPPTSGVADVVCGTREVALGHDAQGEKGERNDHCVFWRRRWDGLDRLCLPGVVRSGLRGAKENSLTERIVSGYIVSGYIDFQEDCASAASVPLA
jgi:hypothetical protein